jgi:hypothetical protein
MKRIINYKKNELYSPDSTEDLPKYCNHYFTQDGLEEWNADEYEYGTLKCIKTFKITISITELD